MKLNSRIPRPKFPISKIPPLLSPHTFQKQPFHLQSYPPSTLNLREIAGCDGKTPNTS